MARGEIEKSLVEVWMTMVGRVESRPEFQEVFVPDGLDEDPSWYHWLHDRLGPNKEGHEWYYRPTDDGWLISIRDLETAAEFKLRFG